MPCCKNVVNTSLTHSGQFFRTLTLGSNVFMDVHLRRHEDKSKDWNKTLSNMHFNITVLELNKVVVLLVMKHISNRKLFENYIQLGLPFSLSLLFLKKLWQDVLTYFMPLVSFYTPWKHQKTIVFLMFPGGKRPVAWNGLKDTINCKNCTADSWNCQSPRKPQKVFGKVFLIKKTVRNRM